MSKGRDERQPTENGRAVAGWRSSARAARPWPSEVPQSRLRAWTPIDGLQVQVASFLGTVCRGDPPLPGDAALLVELSPAMLVNRALDVVLKSTSCIPGLWMIEREFGVLQVHARRHADIQEAGRRLLAAFDLAEGDATPPRIVTRERITGVDPHHAQILNRMRHGDMQRPGDTLYTLEVEPAGYALLAANEAEKAATIDVLEVIAFGAFGRVWLGGDDAAIRLAAEAAERALTPRAW